MKTDPTPIRKLRLPYPDNTKAIKNLVSDFENSLDDFQCETMDEARNIAFALEHLIKRFKYLEEIFDDPEPEIPHITITESSAVDRSTVTVTQIKEEYGTIELSHDGDGQDATLTEDQYELLLKVGELTVNAGNLVTQYFQVKPPTHK
jgi:hypothetical protein